MKISGVQIHLFKLCMTNFKMISINVSTDVGVSIRSDAYVMSPNQLSNYKLLNR